MLQEAQQSDFDQHFQVPKYDEWQEFSQLMMLRDHMDSNAYEIEDILQQALIGTIFPTENGLQGRLIHITGFEMDSEEYIPAYSAENALNAKISFQVDGECEFNGERFDLKTLSVSFDFHYIINDTGYSIEEMTTEYLRSSKRVNLQ